MIDEGENKELEKKKKLIKKEEFQTAQSSLKFKKKLIVLISILILVLIIIISLILIYTLNNNNETNNEDDVEVLPPLVFNSTSGNNTHTIIFMPGLSNSPEDFENVFDEDLIIEVLVRSSYTDETEIEKTLESFTDDMRAQTVRQDYEFLHGPLSENPCDGEIENLTLQCYDKTLDEAILFDLNFDMKCRDGMVTFVGNAYKLDGKWGAMFEPTEYREETDQLSSLLTEGE